MKPGDNEATISPVANKGISYVVQGGSAYALRTSNGHQVWRWDGGDNAFGLWLTHGIVTVLEDQVTPPAG